MAGFDLVDQFHGFALRRNQIKPAPRDHQTRGQSEYAIGNGIAMMVVVKQPCIKIAFTQSRLDALQVHRLNLDSKWKAPGASCGYKFSVPGSQFSANQARPLGGCKQLVTPPPPCWLVIGVPKISAEPRHYWRKRMSERGLPESGYASFTWSKSKPFAPRMNADQHGSEEFDREVLLRVFKDRQSKSAF